MAGRKAEKAKAEIAWRQARAFVRSLEKWMGSGRGNKVSAGGAEGEVDCMGLLGGREKKWVREKYGKAGRKEKRLFLKSAMHFMCLLGTGETGCKNLANTLRRMCAGRAELGEFYEYVLQHSDDKVGKGGGRLGAVASGMEKMGLGKEYYAWFREKYGEAEGGADAGGRAAKGARTPGGLRRARKAVDAKALAGAIFPKKGRLVGSAALMRIMDYLEDGRLTKLAFENRESAAAVAGALGRAGIGDVSLNGSRVNLGLRETLHNAKKRIAGESAGAQRPLETYVEYFRKHGLGEAGVKEVKALLGGGRPKEAAERACRLALQACKKHYLIMGGKRYSFGKEGEKMLLSFRKHAGEGKSSLLAVHDMIGRGEYPPALERLRRIFGAIEAVQGQYPHMF